MNLVLEVNNSTVPVDQVQKAADIYVKPEVYRIAEDIQKIREAFGERISLKQLQPYTADWSLKITERNGIHLRELIASQAELTRQLLENADETSMQEAQALGYQKTEPMELLREQVTVLGGQLLNKPPASNEDTYTEEQLFRNAEREILRAHVYIEDVLYAQQLSEADLKTLSEAYTMSSRALRTLHSDLLKEVEELFAEQQIEFKIFVDWFIRLKPLKQDVLTHNAQHLCKRVAGATISSIKPIFFHSLLKVAQSINNQETSKKWKQRSYGRGLPESEVKKTPTQEERTMNNENLVQPLLQQNALILLQQKPIPLVEAQREQSKEQMTKQSNEEGQETHRIIDEHLTQARVTLAPNNEQQRNVQERKFDEKGFLEKYAGFSQADLPGLFFMVRSEINAMLLENGNATIEDLIEHFSYLSRKEQEIASPYMDLACMQAAQVVLQEVQSGETTISYSELQEYCERQKEINAISTTMEFNEHGNEITAEEIVHCDPIEQMLYERCVGLFEEAILEVDGGWDEDYEDDDYDGDDEDDEDDDPYSLGLDAWNTDNDDEDDEDDDPYSLGLDAWNTDNDEDDNSPGSYSGS